MQEVESAPKTDPANKNPAQANPAQANPAQANPAQVNPAQLNPAQVNPAQINPNGPAAKPGRALSLMQRLGPVALALAACALLAVGGYYAWQAWFGEDSSANTVLTAVVTRGNLEDTVTATGTLQPKDYVDVGTQVSGQLKRLLVDVGAVVKAKDLLAEIDPSVYQAKVDGDQAQLLNQKAQLADKQAQLVLADLQLTRQQNMTRDEATTADALQSAEATRKSALAQVDSIKAQIEQTGSTLRGDEASLGYTKIYAPIAGTVVSQAAKQGQTLNANQQAPIVMRIADLSTMTVQAQVSEADVPKLHVGMDVYFTTLGGDNRRYYGKLRQIPPTPNVVNNVVLYDALFEVENPNQVLMTQMTAQVFFVVSSARNAVLVPLTALRPVPAEVRPRAPAVAGADEGKSAARSGGAERKSGGARSGERASGADARNQFANGRALVSVVSTDGKVTDREVKVGVMNRVSAQILSGLEPGEKVVIGVKAPAAASAARTGSALVPNAAKGGGRP
jgi:membrane fusion protein, macrolide-specific efflux system